jgi:hypothetical protein
MGDGLGAPGITDKPPLASAPSSHPMAAVLSNDPITAFTRPCQYFDLQTVYGQASLQFEIIRKLRRVPASF